MSNPAEIIRKNPINIGSEHSIGFIIPTRWVKKLELSTDREAILELHEDGIFIKVIPDDSS